MIELMFYLLSQYLLKQAEGTAWADSLSPLRLFHYISFRCAGAAVTALLLSLWLGPKVIELLKQLRFGQNYLDKAEEVAVWWRVS
jgi:phospho-N-acetylmuramoyl-pentapeptide-transferase